MQEGSLTYNDRLTYFYDDDPYKEPPDIFDLFGFYNQAFFKNKLLSTQIKWSKKMTLCAGTCKYEGQGSSTITLSEPLLKFRSNNELKETVIHEMIHAYWFATDPESCKIDEGHGPKFLEMMYKINQSTQLSISVFHQFHDEVDRCRQHIWKCNGPCQQRQPYFGIVKRSMNRPPQPADNWFQRHKETCGGQYTKISEPQKIMLQKTEKQQKKKQTQPKKSKTDTTLDSFFKGPKLNVLTRSLKFKLVISEDEQTIVLYYHTPIGFDFKQLITILDKFHSTIKMLSKELNFHQYDFKKYIETEPLWKIILQKELTLEIMTTKLKISLIESEEIALATNLYQVNIVSKYDISEDDLLMNIL